MNSSNDTAHQKEAAMQTLEPTVKLQLPAFITKGTCHEHVIMANTAKLHQYMK